MADAILTLNAGSSSLKFSLFEFAQDPQLHLVSEGQIEGIGTAPHFIVKGPDGTVLAERRWPAANPDYAALIEQVTGWAESHLGSDRLLAVGHRVVHGGPDYDQPQRVTPTLLTALDKLTPLAPLHEPHNIAPMRAIFDARPDLPQVACFDTAFHHGMPVVATRFALPRKYEAEGVRRYGFHGLSYEYISGRLRETAPELAKGRVIAAHLGNGASLCAMQDGHSIDTTMGFTALDGLVMGTRCGALDPGVILYLEQQHGMTAEAVETLLYNESGLLGVSGCASDMRTLLASDDPRARDAVDLFVFRIAREIGALTASLNGLDGLIFTAGIGEHAPQIRAMVCARLGWLGAVLDEEANAREGFAISRPESRIAIHVIPTSEETMIARHTLDMIRPA
jgi:acetate kinase